MMTKLILIAIALLASNAWASATRIEHADSLKSADETKAWTFPGSTQQLPGLNDSVTLTNKTMSGGSNTFSQLPVSSQIIQDTGSGNSSTTAFTLSFAPPTSTGVQVFLDGALQALTTDYTISSTTLTFTTAPATGQSIRVVYSRY